MFGIIYKITPKAAPFGLVYIGSTTQSLESRWIRHKYACQQWIDGVMEGKCTIYPHMKDRGINAFKIEVAKSYEISDANQLTAYEQLWINKTQ